MKNRLVTNIPFLLIVLITLLFAKLQANKHDGASGYCINICSDGRGHYAWLPAAFIYHDLNFTFFDSVEVKQSPCGGPVGGCIQDYRTYFNGKACDKYYPGAACMMLPFFLVAHVATQLFTHYTANGYTPLYFILIGLSGIFYYFLGMFFFLKMLNTLQLSTLKRSLCILLLTFGTNILYYSVDKPSYSHIYSFTLMAAFLYCLLRLRGQYTLKHAAAAAFIAGLIVITRPVNASIFLFIPFALGSSAKPVFSTLLKSKLHLLLSVFLATALPALLLVAYKISTGHFFVYSYAQEGFNFLHPHLLQFLFHYDNGILPYTPLLLMPFAFLFAWYKPEYKGMIVGAILTLSITIYIHSSWWCWSYGFGFGARTMLDFAPLCGLILALSLQQTNMKKHFYMLPVYFLCCVLTMTLYNQKNHGYMTQSPVTGNDYWQALENTFGKK